MHFRTELFTGLLPGILLLWGTMPCSAAIEIDASGGKPAHSLVFAEGQPVRLQIAGLSGKGGAYRVVAYNGDANQGAVPADGALALTLSCGYYELTVSQGAETATAPIVVTHRPRQRAESRLATDAGHAWLLPQERFTDGADLLQGAGFAWARERMRWGEVEPERGVYHWGKYDAVIAAEHAAGIRVYQVFHDSPVWARSDRAYNRFPDDLRDVYRFCKEAARHYHGQVEAWEVWNEADISGFSVDPGCEYAAFLKAAYLGFKAGDPSVKVTQVSMAQGAGPYEESLYRNGTQSYFDIFNYHIYADPREYPSRAAGHFALLDRYGIPTKPVWVTEAGIALTAVNSTLTPDEKRRQAEFIPKSYVMSLASGTDRHFFFVFPHYLENGTEFGAFDGSLRPYPGYAAMATVVAMLDPGTYLGQVTLAGQNGLQAHLFDTGATQTLVVWRDGPAATLTLPVRPTDAHVFNCVGAEQRPTPGDALSLAVGASPLFIRLPRNAVVADGKMLAHRQPGAPPPAPALRDVVLRVRPEGLSTGGEKNAYAVRGGDSIRLTAEIYNFGEKAVTGRVQFRVPDGWGLQSGASEQAFAPGERSVVDAVVTLPKSPARFRDTIQAEVAAAGSAGAGLHSAPAEIDFAFDLASLEATSRVDLDLGSPAKWQDNISGNGAMTHGADPDGGVAFGIRFTSAGDRWAFPTAKVRLADAQADAIELDYATDIEDANTRVRLMLVQQNGSAYYTEGGFPTTRAWRHLVVPVASLVPGSFAPADPDGRLHLERVDLLRFGCNSGSDQITLRLRNVHLVSFHK